MRPDIGFLTSSRQAGFDTDFADKRPERQQFTKAGDGLRVVSKPRAVRLKGSEIAVDEGM